MTVTSSPAQVAPSHLVGTPGRSTLFERWGAFTYRRRKAVLVVALLFTVFAGVWGTTVFGALTGGGFEDPRSESSKAASIIESEFGAVAADAVILYSAPAGSGLTVDDPAFRKSVEAVVVGLPKDDVASVASFWSTGSPAFVSADRTSTYIAVGLTGADFAAREEGMEAVLLVRMPIAFEVERESWIAAARQDAGGTLNVAAAFVVLDQFAGETFHAFDRVEPKLSQQIVIFGDDEHLRE